MLIKVKESLNRIVRGIGGIFCFYVFVNLTLALAIMADGAHMAAPIVIFRN